MSTTTADGLAAILAAFPGSRVVATMPTRAGTGDDWDRERETAPERRERDRRHTERRILAALVGSGRAMTADRLRVTANLSTGETRRVLAAMVRGGIVAERRQGARRLFAAAFTSDGIARL
jgi:hypothetical protein